MVDRNELWAEAEELADLLMQSPEMRSYQQAEQAMKANTGAVSMIMQLKELQEQIGEFQARNVPESYYQSLNDQSESLFEQLEKIQEVREFQASQSAVNDLLQAVTDRLSQAVKSRVAANLEEAAESDS
ncbi:MAG: hypothetical protein A2201_11235 [Alicyclobacillus sp. RIFOXYA1_FULL_53_8]|nr:MAG: hypothetical protein A2201_11235 [Alicyclobacillus sp. RIFOXYA1_FULL_53_8]